MGVLLAVITLLISVCVTAIRLDGLTLTRERHIISDTSSQQGTGTSEAEAILSGATWVTSVKVGGQVLRVQIDTGSSTLWFISSLSDEATKASFPNYTYFDPSKSTTWKLQPDIKFNTSYDVGEEGSFGIVGTETIELGGVTVTDMLVGAATHVFGGIGALDPAYDGIMGLGWAAGSNDFMASDGSTAEVATFMQLAQNQLEQPVFTCDFRVNEPETISFGFVNSSLYTGSLTELAIDNSTNDWLINNITFSSGGKELGLPTGLPVIFDTGGLGTTVDNQTAKDYWSLVNGSSVSSDQIWTFPCNTAVLPDLVMKFPGGAEATLPGAALNQTSESQDGISCLGGVQVAKNGVFNAGYSFYGAYFTVWNQQLPSLSFAPYSTVQDTAGSNEANLPTASGAFPMPTMTGTGLTSPTTTAMRSTGEKVSNMPVLALIAMVMAFWIL